MVDAVVSAFAAPVGSLRGVAARRGALLAARRIHTLLDLLLLIPTRYEAPPPLRRAAEITPGVSLSLTGTVTSARRVRQRRGGSFLDLVVDSDGVLVRVCFWNRGWLVDRVAKGDSVLVSGTGVEASRVTLAGAGLHLIKDADDIPRRLCELSPVHPAVKGVAEGTLRLLIREALAAVAQEHDPVDAPTRTRLKLPGLHAALLSVHEPATREDAERGALRLVFDRLVSVVLKARLAGIAAMGPAPALPTDTRVRQRILARFPFALTGGQQAALAAILEDCGRDIGMRRLLCGDVGSGKTAVAAGALLAAVAARAQGLLVAPTEVVALQHHATLTRWLRGSRVRLGLLLGGMPAADRRLLLKRTAAGEIDVLIGTHAALAARVKFRRLGLAVVDEQHRFGVLQRLAAREKAERPHLLALSATPIPRSLALAFCGDLVLTRLIGRPGDRPIPVTTIVDEAESFRVARAALDAGGRVFVVYPSINSDTAPAVERDGRDLGKRGGPFARDTVAFLHGDLPSEDRQSALANFRSGAARVLVATAIVEVGVDVPEATLMIVMGADRFGLASLHQLRGRVGRGSAPGRVLLVPTDTADAAAGRSRLEILTSQTDGFAIAEADLTIRGPGDFCGVRQHGQGGALPFIAGRDAGLLQEAEACAGRLVGSGCAVAPASYLSMLGCALGTVGFDPADAL